MPREESLNTKVNLRLNTTYSGAGGAEEGAGGAEEGAGGAEEGAGGAEEGEGGAEEGAGGATAGGAEGAGGATVGGAKGVGVAGGEKGADSSNHNRGIHKIYEKNCCVILKIFPSYRNLECGNTYIQFQQKVPLWYNTVFSKNVLYHL